MRLARRHGQAAVYVLESGGGCADSGGGGGFDGSGGGLCGGGEGVAWRLAVVPCFPGLDGLASDDVAAVVRAPPSSMPGRPEDKRFK